MLTSSVSKNNTTLKTVEDLFMISKTEDVCKTYISIGITVISSLLFAAVITTPIFTNNNSMYVRHGFIITCFRPSNFLPKSVYAYCIIFSCFFYHGATALLGQGLLIVADSQSHSDTPHSVGLLWTSDQPDLTTHNTDRRTRTQCESSPRSKQASGRRPTP